MTPPDSLSHAAAIAARVRGRPVVAVTRLHSICNDVHRVTFDAGPDAVIKQYSRGHGADLRRRGDRAATELRVLALLARTSTPVPAVEAADTETGIAWLMMTSAGDHKAGNTDGLTDAQSRAVFRDCGRRLADVHAIAFPHPGRFDPDARGNSPVLLQPPTPHVPHPVNNARATPPTPAPPHHTPGSSDPTRATPDHNPASSDPAPEPLDPVLRWALGRARGAAGVTDELLAQLRDAALRPPARAVLCHGDFHPDQCVRSGPTLTALLDWESATAGDPEADHAKFANYLHVYFPPHLAAEALAGYRPAPPLALPDPDDPRYLALRLIHALPAVPREPAPAAAPADPYARAWAELAADLLARLHVSGPPRRVAPPGQPL